MSLKEKAPYLSNKFIRCISELYPDIETIYEKNPYFLLDIEDINKEEIKDMPTFIDIDTHTTIKTFELKTLEVRAACMYVLKCGEQLGNSWIKFTDLNKSVLNLLRKTGHPLLKQSITPYINYYGDVFSYDRKRGIVSLYKSKLKEYKIRRGIKSLQQNRVDLSLFNPIDQTNRLSSEQLNSSRNVVTMGGNIALLTGGPGTGKTTVTKSVVTGINHSYPTKNIVLLAPTGKATKRIQEEFPNQDIQISTIHIFVGWGFNNLALLKAKKKVEETDIIIIDEASMVGVDVLSQLFDLINTVKTKLIFIGDEHQLPAIGIGDTINDLKSMNVYEEHLWINYRSSEAIIANATRINAGDFRITEDESFEFIDINSCVAEELLSKEMARTRKVEILLSPYRKHTMAGNTSELNSLVHNERYGSLRKDYVNGLCVGDRVMLVNTNYKRKYFNGDTGTLEGVCKVKEKGETYEAFVIRLNTGEIVKVIEEDDIELAYAITIHKSQGSEYDIVNIYIPEYSPFITREMLYTAITRAKKKVRLWTTMDIYKKIVLTETPKRKTMISLWNHQDAA